MNAAEFHQQQLEHQEYLESLKSIKDDMNSNHGKMVGVATWLRDYAKTASDKELAIEYLLEALEEYNTIERRVK
jgi:hypothetical protein